jgi:hypothetical protein
VTPARPCLATPRRAVKPMSVHCPTRVCTHTPTMNAFQFRQAAPRSATMYGTGDQRAENTI